MKDIQQTIDELKHFFEYSKGQQQQIISKHIDRLEQVKEILREIEEQEFNTQGE